MATAFFGGSFDPPHAGHLAVAAGALASGMCTHVLWVPAYAPPHKMGRERASFADRLHMVELLLDGREAMSVSDLEKRLGLSPSYTIDVLGAWERESGERPLLLIGADSLRELHTWHEAGRLVREYRILTYPRRNSEITADLLRRFWGGKETEKLLEGVIPGKFFEISSSEIRKSMEKSAKGSHIMKEAFFPDSVAGYIAANRLYQDRSLKEPEIGKTTPERIGLK